MCAALRARALRAPVFLGLLTRKKESSQGACGERIDHLAYNMRWTRVLTAKLRHTPTCNTVACVFLVEYKYYIYTPEQTTKPVPVHGASI
jgi:hypothetical protein